MSAERREPADEVRAVIGAWAENLADVLQSMTDQKPVVAWETASGPVLAGTEDPLLWWEQPLEPAIPEAGGRWEEMILWLAAPHASWEFAGSLTLKTAGLADATESDARNTWCEIVGQSLGAVARAVGEAAGYEIRCGTGAERAPANPASEWISVRMRFPDSAPLSLALVLSPRLAEGAFVPLEEKQEPESPASPSQPQPQSMELLLDVDLPVSISFGRTQLPLSDVLKLTTGSIVELNCSPNDQVEVLVNHCLVARGEVVVVDGNYGVRVLEIASRRDRLRSLR